MELKINPKFRDALPPLTEEALSLLEEAILKEGCRDCILTWNDYIVDGHNRYQICSKHNKPFSIQTIPYAWELHNEDEVVQWIIDNQLGRRNLSDYEKGAFILKRKERYVEKGKQNMSAGGKSFSPKKGSSDLANLPNEKTDAWVEMEKASGVKAANLKKIAKIEESASEELKEKVIAGEVSIGLAHQAVNGKEPSEEIYFEDSIKKHTFKIGEHTIRSQDRDTAEKTHAKAKEELTGLKDLAYIEKIEEVKEFKKELEKQPPQKVVPVIEPVPEPKATTTIIGLVANTEEHISAYGKYKEILNFDYQVVLEQIEYIESLLNDFKKTIKKEISKNEK